MLTYKQISPIHTGITPRKRRRNENKQTWTKYYGRWTY